MEITLAAVQAEIRPEAYERAEAFIARVDELVAMAVEGIKAGPRIVALPELFALPLLLWLEAPPEVRAARSLTEAAWAWARALGLVRSLTKGPWGVHHLRAQQVWEVWSEAVRSAAKKHRAYVFAGTSLLPRLDEEPAKGVYATSTAVYNYGFWATPRGRLLGRPEKLRLTPDERRGLVRPGRWADQVIATRLGRIATLVCLDAFHEALVERADAAGAWLLVQPSANARTWAGPWSADPDRVEGEVWLERGLKYLLKDREHLAYGLNPMLTGSLYELGFEGRANVAAPGETLALSAAPTGDGLARDTVVRP